jgi:hypothetical protein
MLGLRPTPTLHPKIKSCCETCVPPALCCSRASSLTIVLMRLAWQELIASIREAVVREPLFIAIDYEGGRVSRIPSPITRYAYAQD